jgi:membrane associated rhomboid family serine protease
MITIFFIMKNFYDTGYDIIDYPLRAFYHGSLDHLIANGISFYSLSFIEDIMGWKQYLFAIVFIWIVSSLLLYTEHKILPSRKVYTVGFSAVIFGLIVIYYSLLGQSSMVTFTGLAISLLPQLFVPGISWEGHLCGIIAGIIYILLFPLDKNMSQSFLTSISKIY